MKQHIKWIVLALLASSQWAQAARIKDISNIRGVRENQVIGYGLVVGLNGTGDGKDEFTSKSFARMLDMQEEVSERKSIFTRGDDHRLWPNGVKRCPLGSLTSECTQRH